MSIIFGRCSVLKPKVMTYPHPSQGPRGDGIADSVKKFLCHYLTVFNDCMEDWLREVQIWLSYQPALNDSEKTSAFGAQSRGRCFVLSPCRIG